jgi:N-acetylglucosaminyldiphosphoundecaprenol N-acetyl-beta-D-mannosaminyltransferase
MADHSVKYILGVPFSDCQFKDVLEGFQYSIQKRSRDHISITNTETLYHAVRIPELFHFINQAVYSCCDGVAITLCARTRGVKIPRLHGPDLLMQACSFGIEKGWRHYFYGGKAGVAKLLCDKLTQNCPGIAIAGAYSPPFRPIGTKETPSIIYKINEAKPDIIWVGLGLLKQWKWISDHRGSFEAPLMIGVGAAFDFHAGTIRRAPIVFQKLGMEWLYRLYFEPRMLKRNLMSLMIVLKLLTTPLSLNRIPPKLRHIR